VKFAAAQAKAYPSPFGSKHPKTHIYFSPLGTVAMILPSETVQYLMRNAEIVIDDRHVFVDENELWVAPRLPVLTVSGNCFDPLCHSYLNTYDRVLHLSTFDVLLNRVEAKRLWTSIHIWHNFVSTKAERDGAISEAFAGMMTFHDDSGVWPLIYQWFLGKQMVSNR